MLDEHLKKGRCGTQQHNTQNFVLSLNLLKALFMTASTLPDSIPYLADLPALLLSQPTSAVPFGSLLHGSRPEESRHGERTGLQSLRSVRIRWPRWRSRHPSLLAASLSCDQASSLLLASPNPYAARGQLRNHARATRATCVLNMRSVFKKYLSISERTKSC